MCGPIASKSRCGRRDLPGWCERWQATGGQRCDTGKIRADGETITVHVPMTFRKRGGRKRVMPDGSEWAPRPRVDNAMVKALARAFRWRKMMDEGVYATLDDLARAKGVTATCLSRILRLTLLAPEIVEAILEGRQPAGLQLDNLLKGFPLVWKGSDSAFLPSCCRRVR
jgi:hypothetical protein